jgi:glycosyltransferase involved in cell wall biosynthesis
MKSTPLISCLCITHNNLAQLQRAINCFKSQTYPNKELLILYESDNDQLRNRVETDPDESIYFVEVPAVPKLTLGQLRNIAVEKCNGDLFCQWDDDDWYASNRLEVQMEAVTQNWKPASMLVYWLMYDSCANQAYLSPFRLWEGSILCKKAIITQECNYASLVKGEDTILLGKLIENNSIFPVVKPNLYIYVFHGNNTWNYKHFNHFYKRGQKLSGAASDLVKDILEGRYTVEEGTLLLNSPAFLKEVNFKYKLVDRYRLTLQ